MHEQTTYRFIRQEAYGEWNIMSGNHPNGGWIAWAKKGALLKRDPLEEPGEVFFEFGLGRQGAIDLLIKNNLEYPPMYSRSINPPETAPKDCQIMADFGWPWLQPARWCKVSKQWATSLFNACEVDGVWFETEWHDESELRGWMPYPQLSKPDSAEEHF